MNVLDQLRSGLGPKPSMLHGALNALFAGVPGGLTEGGVGDLPSLVHRFEAVGLGNLVHSWIALGPNDPITPEQVELVLGAHQVAALAAQTGLTRNQLLDLLVLELPILIDKLTPDGRLTEG
jgi:uncharacterized protein YidB (DUF937 family)